VRGSDCPHVHGILHWLIHLLYIAHVRSAVYCFEGRNLLYTRVTPFIFCCLLFNI